MLASRRIAHHSLRRWPLGQTSSNVRLGIAAATSFPLVYVTKSAAMLEHRSSRGNRGSEESFTGLARSIRSPNPRKGSMGIARLYKRIINALRGLLRALKIAAVLSPLPALAVSCTAYHNIVSLTGGENKDAAFLIDAAWAYTTGAMQHLGPCFVKLCQWAATRRDLFSEHMCDR